MSARTEPAARRPLGRRGVALPVALLGLIMISLLVTTALLSSSAETAIVGTQRDAVKGLYRADAALQQFVSSRMEVVDSANYRFADGTRTFTSDGTAYNITIAQLRDSMRSTADSAFLVRTFSILASPGSGVGRAVGAMLQTQQVIAKLTTNVNAGATSGGNINVSGNATISDGRNASNCSLSKADYALQATRGSTISTGGSSTIMGGTNITSYTKADIIDQLLDGIPLDTMAKYADIKFGPRFGQPDFNGTVNDNPSTPKKYNWGCPTGMDIDCEGPASDTLYVPVIAIDANGGTVGIQNDFGQGLLIVVNGSLAITGKFSFKGLVLVERDIDVRGTGGNVGKIEGAVVALGESSTIADNFNGNATITYNRCSVNAATNALNSSRIALADQLLLNSNRAWFEVVH
ncbi:MAG TPA: pilus assembly PilX N-terminal domain-containing protein [Longimicrobiaceae bacterium]|nr:pilus assembly PilX N-terminal domain-containing protein [Longimicrobiaceae bacterium]